MIYQFITKSVQSEEKSLFMLAKLHPCTPAGHFVLIKSHEVSPVLLMFQISAGKVVSDL